MGCLDSGRVRPASSPSSVALRGLVEMDEQLISQAARVKALNQALRSLHNLCSPGDEVGDEWPEWFRRRPDGTGPGFDDERCRAYLLADQHRHAARRRFRDDGPERLEPAGHEQDVDRIKESRDVAEVAERSGTAAQCNGGVVQGRGAGMDKEQLPFSCHRREHQVATLARIGSTQEAKHRAGVVTDQLSSQYGIG